MRWLVFKVRTYIPPVAQCYRCQGYRHAASHCYRTDDICKACADKHKFEVCPNKEEKKCTNCIGGHSAESKDCPKYLETKIVVRRAAEERILYQE